MKKLLCILTLAALLCHLAVAENSPPGFHTALDYEAVLSNPEAHRGEKYDLSGMVTKAQKARIRVSNWSNPYQLLIALNDAPQNIIWVLGDCPANYEEISAGDHVRFIGTYQGLADIAVSTGGTASIPFFMAGTLYIPEK